MKGLCVSIVISIVLRSLLPFCLLIKFVNEGYLLKLYQMQIVNINDMTLKNN